MYYWQVIPEFWCLLLFCHLIGRQWIQSLPPVMRRSIGFYITPILGLATLVHSAVWYGWWGKFSPSKTWLLTGSLITIALLMEIKRKQIKACFRDFGLLSLFATGIALPIFVPILRHAGYNPFTDIFTYLAQSQWLQFHPFSEPVIASGHFPAWTQIQLYQVSGSRMGGSFFLAYVQSLFHIRWSYVAYIPAVSIGFVAGVFALGAIIRQVIPLHKLPLLWLTLLLGLLQTGFIFGAMWGFYPQTLGLAFVAGVCALLPYSIHLFSKYWISFHRNKHPVAIYSGWHLWIGLMPAAICSSSLLLAYNEPFPIFTLGLGIFFFIVLCRNTKAWRRLLILYVIYCIAVIALTNHEMMRIVQNLYQTLSISRGNNPIGWPVLWLPVQFLAFAFGMKSPFDSRLISFDGLNSLLIFPVFFLGMIFSLVWFVRTHPQRRSTIGFLIAIELVLLGFFLKFRYATAPTIPVEVGHTFLQFKIAKYAAPFSLGLGGIFLAMLWFYLPQYRRLLRIFYASALGIVLWLQCISAPKNLTHHFLAELKQTWRPFDVLLQLRESVAHIPPNDVIHLALGQEHSKLRQMVAYVLYDRKLSSNYTDDGYILGHLPASDHIMDPMKAQWLLVMNNTTANCDHQVQQQAKAIGPFRLLKQPFYYLTREKQEGAYDAEFNAQGETWNWVRDTVNYQYQSLSPADYQVQFAFNLVSYTVAHQYRINVLDENNKPLAHLTLSVQQPKSVKKKLSLFGKRKSVQPIKQQVITPWIKTNAKHLTLQITADGKAQRLSKRDYREAQFMVANVGACLKQ